MRLTLAGVMMGVMLVVVMMVAGCSESQDELRRLLWGDPQWDVVVCPHGAACESLD